MTTANYLTDNQGGKAVATAAVKAKCKYIITRNTRDFAASPIPALTPAEFLAI